MVETLIPILFAPNEKDFTSNGLGRLTDCRKFEVTEERNGIYDAYFEYPIDGPLFSQLQYGYYVYATHDESKTPQAFEIYRKEASLDGWAKFRAWHISYALNNTILRPFSANSCMDALSKINDNIITGTEFTYWTDKAVSGSFSVDVPKSARAVLGGSSGSILDVYGKGDYEFDMFTVKLHVNRGADRGVSIRYGKNLTKLDQTLEGGSVLNGVVPFWQSTDGDVVAANQAVYGNAVSFDVPLQTQSLEVLQTHFPENIYAQYVNLKVQALDLSDDFEDPPTEADLISRAQQLMASSDAYEVSENIAIDFVQLWQTEEYKNVASLQRVFLCDTVHVYYEKLGVTASAKVIKVVYDTLRERYSAMELGQPKTTLSQEITNVVSDNVMTEVRGLIKGLPDKGYMETAIEYATRMIQGGLGGYVVIEPDASGHPEEILIMDTPDKTTAVNVWRFNQGGLGHSSTGYNGPYSDIALTADGKINASLITTGTLDASVVNVENINADNITSGTINAININGSTITGSTLESTASGGSIKIADGSIDFYQNATTTGTPFSQLAHIYNSSLGQHAIEWRTTGYTKLINEAGGQWTGDFIQFALNAQDPHLMFLIYPDSDGTHAKFNTDIVDISGEVKGLYTTLWTGTKVTSGTITLNDSLYKYGWLAFTFNTNVDKAYEFVRRADFESGNLMKSWSAGSWNGSRFQYNTWVQLTRVDNTHISVTNGYNDGNWQGGLVAVYGLKIL